MAIVDESASYKIFRDGDVSGCTILNTKRIGREVHDKLSREFVGKYDSPGALMVAIDKYLCPEMLRKDAYDNVMHWLSKVDESAFKVTQ
ncbi:MAG: hypothetical protein U9Q92_02340 [archaeon]|nr:hypothetical protein [archaeon]